MSSSELEPLIRHLTSNKELVREHYQGFAFMNNPRFTDKLIRTAGFFDEQDLNGILNLDLNKDDEYLRNVHSDPIPERIDHSRRKFYSCPDLTSLSLENFMRSQVMAPQPSSKMSPRLNEIIQHQLKNFYENKCDSIASPYSQRQKVSL